MSIRMMLLLATCAGLAYMAVGVEAPEVPAPPSPRLSAPPPPPRISSMPNPPSGPWSEQSARPLFSQDRRPPAVAPAAVTRREPEPQPPLSATGIAMRPGGAIALLKVADDRTVRVSIGDDVDGWTVAGISEEGVRLTRGQRSLTLSARITGATGLARGD